MSIHTTIAAHNKERVLDLLRRSPGGLTDFEIANHLGMYLSSVNASRNALMNLGAVKATGVKRPSGRGGMAKVWAITPAL